MGLPRGPRPRVVPDQVEDEVKRLREAVGEVVAHLNGLGQKVLRRAGPEEARIFDAQILMAQDQEFLNSVEFLIRNNQLSAETAYEFKALELRNLWSGAARLRERLADLNAIQFRMISRLMGRSAAELGTISPDEHVIVVAHELSPGLTVQLDREHVVGLVSEEGTRTAHAAILAHSLGIPAVMGAVGALARIPDGAMLLLDGQSGVIVLEPTLDELDDAKTQISRRSRLELQLEGIVDQPAVTPSGRPILLQGNVDLPEEIESASGSGRRAWACCALSSSSPVVPPCPPRTSRRRTSAASPWPSRGTPSSSAPSISAGTSSRLPSSPHQRPTRSWAGGRSACAWTSRRCSGRRCAPCSARPWVGTSSSCFPWSPGWRR